MDAGPADDGTGRDNSQERRQRLRAPDVEDDRHRPVVYELDCHSRSEHSGLHRHAQCSKRVAEALVQRLGDLGLSRSRERRTVAFRSVGNQGELAHDERRASRVEQRAIELARLVLEDPQPRDLAGEAFSTRFRVPVGDAEQDEDARPYLAAGR
jgi:hypothetical protein